MRQILEARKPQIFTKGAEPFAMACEKQSLAGAVSQRACVFCGSRVVLYPIADAIHVVHGPIGCAAYTWDIRGALSSGPELHRLSFSTDLDEMDVIQGGEKKLHRALGELIDHYRPKAAFVYSTCIVGIIGDDVAAVCRRVEAERGIPVLPIHSEGFRGTKKDGYRAACDGLAKLVGTGPTDDIGPHSINILGDFNLAGETWMIRDAYRRIGIDVVATITGDGRVDDVRRAHGARLNVVQCSGSMIHLARSMRENYGIPFLRVSYFGIEDMAKSLYDVAEHFGDKAILGRARELVRNEVETIMPELRAIRRSLEGRRAAIYTGGAFKAFSLVRSLRTLGMKTVVAGSQTGNREDYELLRELCDEGTILVDDTNPLELSQFVQEKNVDLFIGGVKERPIAYKLGIGFCDHNHERKEALAGFDGMLNFAREVYRTVVSPVWQFVGKEGTGKGDWGLEIGGSGLGARETRLRDRDSENESRMLATGTSDSPCSGPMIMGATAGLPSSAMENSPEGTAGQAGSGTRKSRSGLPDVPDGNVQTHSPEPPISSPQSLSPNPSFTATRNACKLCAPLGACLAFRGVEGAIPFLHGSQGCATYIRRYMISHFKEPLDIASSNFGEATAIFGGRDNLRLGLENVVRQYDPQLIGIATTCLAETIGDDVALYLRELRDEFNADGALPLLVHASTPSFAGTHAEGFWAAVRALVDALAEEKPRHEAVNLLPGQVSPADLRYLKAIMRDFGLEPIVLPDYSETLDGPIWKEYQSIPEGGTPIASIRRMGGSRATVEFTATADPSQTAGALLGERFDVAHHALSLPIGVRATDRFFEILQEISGRPVPPDHQAERGRLLDNYIDAHKYVFGRRAVVYGEQELVVGIASLLAEIGVLPVLCASGAKTGRLKEQIRAVAPDMAGQINVREGVDFAQIEQIAVEHRADLVIGNSKGYGLGRRLGIPLIRVGFPVHDRIDGPRLLHVGYRGAQQLFDRVANAVIEAAQDGSDVGYSYM